MKKTMMRLLAVLLTVAMLCSMLPVMASAQETVEAPKEITKKSEAIVEADIWDKIESFEDDNIIATRDDPITAADYAELSDEIEALVKQSETFVEGSVVRNGDFFTWETSEGIVCGYSPELRFKTRNNAETGDDEIVIKSYATKASPSSKNVYLIAPYYGYDSSFTNQYKNEADSIADATGGQYTLYQGTNATITNIATAMQNGGVVIFDSHGTTDYANGEDYVSRANTSYLCLKTSTGITSSDMSAVSGSYGTYYHAFNGGSGTYCVDGTAIKNHMSKAAPGTILWMAICLGMATNGLCIPMRNAGVEVVYGYSQSVSFTGDYKYETYFWNKMKAGSDVKTAISYMKSAAGSNWDPAYASYSLSSAKANYVAFPIVVSDQDSYPGQGKVDAVQTVNSTYKLIESGSGSSGSGSSGSTGSGATATGGNFTLVTSASNLTAGDYIIIAAANGSYAGDYSYYALTTEQDGTYATMQSNPLSFTSLPTTLSCDDANAGYFVYTLKGNANGFTLTTDLGSLEGGADSEGTYLYYGNATTWKASYNSTSKGFQLAGDGANMALRDDISTMGSNDMPMFAASSSSGTVVMHMYKRETSGTTTCSHSSTSSSTTPATCTTAGSTTVTCNSCGTVVSTTTIPATGHNISYSSNGDGTHDLYCSNCNGTGTADCTFTDNVCNYCGYNNSGSDSSDSIRFTLVTSASDLTAGEYLIMAGATGTYAGNYNYYVMTTAVDSQYAMLQGTGLNFDSLPTGLLLDPSAYDTFVWIAKGNANGVSWKTPGGTYLSATSGSTGLSLANSSSNWTASYSSSKQGFTLSSLNRYLALRDDVSTTGDNGVCGFTTISTVAYNSYMHLYKRVDSSSACSHSDTSTSTTPATCTEAGETLVICDDCGETVSSTTIPALGHDYTYTSNNNGTHKIGCSRCSYSKSENCTMVNGTCSYCGYTEEPELPDEPEVPAAELTEGQYVVAAYVDGEYYAMSNAFESKIDGNVVTVIDGKVPAEDAIDYVITLTSAEGGWVIEGPDGSYLKYNSSTNLAKTTDPYVWNISEGTNGTWRVAAQTSGRGLVFRAKTYNQFGGYSTTNCTEGSAEYFDIEFLPIDGEIIEPEEPACTHENTETVTEDPTCTESGTTTVICADCGEIISTTTIPATGHDYSYVGNGDGTHTGTCANCGDTDSGDCTDPEGVCDQCGADNTPDEPELPDEPEVPAAELTEGQYVVAAYADGVYYAMSNTFASKINGTEITVVDGKVPAAEAEGYVITLTSVDGAWVIEGPEASYLKYNSSTNLAKATEPYAWTITEGTNGTWRVAAQTSGRGLVFRAKTYNQFGGYSTTNCTEGSVEYFDIEFLPIDGEIIEPEEPACTHENTETLSIPATCTEEGSSTVTCTDCGEIISTTTIPATGHDYSYVGNGDGTHTGTCANCGDTDSSDCTDPEGICDVCGADNTPAEPELPEQPVIDLTEGRYVVAANVNGVYYAMSNTFASKIGGTEIRVIDGQVAEADAEGYVITLSSVEGGWVIEGPNGTYLKYASSTNLGNSAEPYAWVISEGTNGSWRVDAQTEGRGLVFRAKTYNQFGAYATSNCSAGSAEYFDVEFLPVADIEIGEEEPEIFNVNIRHSLNLANDISVNYVVTMDQLAGYSDFYLEIDIPNYVGNDYMGSDKVVLQPVAKGDYYYFTLEGMTAVQMNDMLTATLFATKDGELYASEVDIYSIGTYAYNQLEKTTTEAELKNLCAELLRYGSKAQLFKGYRTDDLVDETMTDEQKALLVNLEDVVFGNNNTVLDDVTDPTVTWGGKSLDLNTKVVMRMVVNLSNYTGNMSDLSLRVSYVDLTGEEITVEIKEYKVYDASRNFYVFDFAELCAAELRTVVSVAAYEGDRQVSPTLLYSADTYGNGKTGDLLVACQALMAYSDAALIYFTK